MFTLKLDSSREQHSKDTTYVLSAGDIISALEPRLLADMHLALRFNARQAYWKEQRETIDENGTYSLMHCNYDYSRRRVDIVDRHRPWAAEERPQIVEASIKTIPRRAIPAGVSLRQPIRELLSKSFLAAAPAGLPALDGNPKYAWYFDLEFAAPERILRALLSRPGNTGQWQVWHRLEATVVSARDQSP